MSGDSQSTAAVEPETPVKPTPKRKSKSDQRKKPKRQPKYHVLLWDSDDHSYEYVMKMMKELFHHSTEKAFEIAKEVDKQGRAVCLTTTMEHAELKRDQIHAYGKDAHISRCKGSMFATIEAER